MLWVLVDVALGLVAVVVLGLVVLGLWRKVKDLGRELSRAGAVIGQATDALAEQQASQPPRA